MFNIAYRYLRKTLKIKWHNYRNKRYWTKYYKAHRDNLQPSTFARFCFEKYCENSQTHKLLLDLGCGNGRDSIYFMTNGLDVSGIDIAGEELRYLRSKKLSKNLNFVCSDFPTFKKYNHYDYVYSRFTLHAVTEEQETSTLENSYKNLVNNGLLFIEARSVKDDMFSKSTKLSDTEGETDHYRRFIVFEDLKKKVEQTGFEILEAVEAKGLAAYKDDDPVVIRIIARKQKND